MGKLKKNPDGLSVLDTVEGSSEEGRAVFREVCNRLTTQQIGMISGHRVLAGTRRVTRDLLAAAMEQAGIAPEEADSLWTRYFGAPPTTLPEFIRRRAIIAGGVRTYAESLGVSHATICTIMSQQFVTFDVLQKLLERERTLPWKDEDLRTRWRREYESFLMRRYGINLLAARVRMAFDMRPEHSLEHWLTDDQLPPGLGTSKNRIRKLVGILRSGIPESWDCVLPVLTALGCTETEIAEVREAWQNVPSSATTEAATSAPAPETKDESIHDPTSQGAELHKGEGAIPAHVHEEPVGDTTARPSPPAPAHSRRRKSRVSPPGLPATDEALSIMVAPPTIETPEVRLFGDEEAEADTVGSAGESPNVAGIASVWCLGEYLRNFSARGSAGYNTAEAAFAVIAQEVRRRAPLSINDTASALKMLVYSSGRFPDHEGTRAIMDAIEESIGTTHERVPGRELMTLLAAEPRFGAFLLYYSTSHPKSPVTRLLATHCDLTRLVEHPNFDPDEATDSDMDYAAILRPPPRVREPKQKKERARPVFGKRQFTPRRESSRDASGE